MFDRDLFVILCGSLPGVMVIVELFTRLPISESFNSILLNTRKSSGLIASSAISDHWKEKALRGYSFKILLSTLKVAFYLMLSFAAFGAVYFFMGILLGEDPYGTLHSVALLKTQVIICVLGIVYGCLRFIMVKRISRSESDYGASARFLHHIALGNSIVKEIAFETDCIAVGMKKGKNIASAPVYVTGLARSGTTILLEALYATGAFSSLTYRDMPFVTAPYLWSRISKSGRVNETGKKERAHGDKVYANYDSPEAFEEVFWMALSGGSYIKKHHLELQKTDHDLVENYRKYIRNILSREDDGKPYRYLAKNNINILRIDMITSAFPDATVIVPFRNPINHATSLLSQHDRFCAKHAADSFALAYMNWLGHFEFGLNLKRFMVDQNGFSPPIADPTDVSYWLWYWKYIYDFLIERHSHQVLFFNYDAFCEQPERHLASLESRLQLSEGTLSRFSKNIRPSKKYDDGRDAKSFPPDVRNVYETLKTKAYDG